MRRLADVGTGWLLIGAAARRLLCGAAAAIWAGRRVWAAARRLTSRAAGARAPGRTGPAGRRPGPRDQEPPLHDQPQPQAPGRRPRAPRRRPSRRLLRRLEAVQARPPGSRTSSTTSSASPAEWSSRASPSDLRRLVGELADFFAPQAAGRPRGDAHARCPRPPVRCSVDANLIKQALLNLMINAVQAMPRGRRTAHRAADQSQPRPRRHRGHRHRHRASPARTCPRSSRSTTPPRTAARAWACPPRGGSSASTAARSASSPRSARARGSSLLLPLAKPTSGTGCLFNFTRRANTM